MKLRNKKFEIRNKSCYVFTFKQQRDLLLYTSGSKINEVVYSIAYGKRKWSFCLLNIANLSLHHNCRYYCLHVNEECIIVDTEVQFVCFCLAAWQRLQCFQKIINYSVFTTVLLFFIFFLISLLLFLTHYSNSDILMYVYYSATVWKSLTAEVNDRLVTMENVACWYLCGCYFVAHHPLKHCC